MTHPAVRDLFHTLSRDPAFQDLAAKLIRRDAGPFSLAGLTPTAKALYLVLLWQVTERPMLVVSDNNQHAEALAGLQSAMWAQECQAVDDLLIAVFVAGVSRPARFQFSQFHICFVFDQSPNNVPDLTPIVALTSAFAVRVLNAG